MDDVQYRRCYEAVKNDPRFPTHTFLKCLNDDTTECSYDSHYILHTAWAARVLAETKPSRHVDIGSSLYFVGIVSAFVPIDFYDYRAVSIPLDGLTVQKADVTCLPFANGSIKSLSCLHTLEHIGLGRYGDETNPSGDIKAARELQRVLADDGNLLIAVPVGASQLVFNGHRIYSYEQVVDMFPDLFVAEFALIPDEGRQLSRYATPGYRVNSQNYACGCFRFKKR